MKIFKEIAKKDKGTMWWYVEFKLHLLCNEMGEIVNFVFSKANVNDRNEKVIDTMTTIFWWICSQIWERAASLQSSLKSILTLMLLPSTDNLYSLYSGNTRWVVKNQVATQWSHDTICVVSKMEFHSAYPELALLDSVGLAVSSIHLELNIAWMCFKDSFNYFKTLSRLWS